MAAGGRRVCVRASRRGTSTSTIYCIDIYISYYIVQGAFLLVPTGHFCVLGFNLNWFPKSLPL